jgi:membrane protein DedA with SNARE-associated domain
MLNLTLTDPHLLSVIKTIGYPTMLLVMIAEGPLMTIVAAFLASLGYFNVGVVFLLSIIGDMIGDVLFYYIGYFGGSRTLLRAEKLLKIKATTVEKIKNLFVHHGMKTIFMVKSTTGLCWIGFITAGTVKMDIKKFIAASFFGGLVWSLFLVLSGFFFGRAFEEINYYIKYAGIIIFFSVVAFFTMITLFKKYSSKKMLENETI